MQCDTSYAVNVMQKWSYNWIQGDTYMCKYKHKVYDINTFSMQCKCSYDIGHTIIYIQVSSNQKYS